MNQISRRAAMSRAALARARARISPPPIAWRLSLYVLARFAFYLAVTFAVFTVLTYFGALTELLRRSAASGAPFWSVAVMALLQTPSLLERLLPLAFLASSMFCFLSLARLQEAIIARGAGLSHLMLATPVVAASLAAGILTVTILNPAISLLASRFEQMEARYIKNQTSSTATLLEGGLWLRTAERDGSISVMHALEIGVQAKHLRHATLLLYSPSGRLIQRADADSALLEPGRWHLRAVRVGAPGETPVFHQTLMQETTLTPMRIQESLASPETISFWGLRRFVGLAEAAGFAAIPHWVHYYKLLTLPLFLAATALLGAAWAVFYVPRIGRIINVVMAGGLSGFGLYIFASFFETLALGGDIPPSLAVSAPALIAGSAGLTLTLFGEK